MGGGSREFPAVVFFSSRMVSRAGAARGVVSVLLGALAPVFFGAGVAAARVVINELYYDHPGADAGHEFIELVNDGGGAVDLSGFTIEFHNGSGTGWTAIWHADPGAILAADALFVIGGELVTPVPDVVLALSLQNGPDAIRLTAGDGSVLDVVGYGGLDDPAYVERRGVPVVAAGRSIARRLDAADSDDNAADFAAAVPTPGRRNVARHDVSLALAPGTPARAAAPARGAGRVTVTLANRGRVAVEAGAAVVNVSDSSAAGVFAAGSAANRAMMAPGEAELLGFTVPLDPGYHWLRFDARYASDEREDNDRAIALRRAGRIPVLVSEVWSAPPDGCPQFVELMNAGDAAVDLGGFSLRDARARPVVLAADTLLLAPRAWLAVSADADRLVRCVRGTPDAGVIGVDGSWPAFNRSGGAVADSVVLLDALGIPVDAVAYPPLPAGVAGRSLERVDLFLHDGPAVWRVSDAPAGSSPALANGAFVDRPAPEGEVSVHPNPFVPAAGEILQVTIGPSAEVARVEVRVYDTGGRRVATAGAASSFPAVVVWDGRRDDGGVARPGLYVVACEAWRADGARAGVHKVVVGCAGEKDR